MPFKNPEDKLFIENLLYFNPGITGSNVVISKESFINIGGFNIYLMTSNDKAFMIDAFQVNLPIVILSKNQAIVRKNDQINLTDDPFKRFQGVAQFIKKYRYSVR